LFFFFSYKCENAALMIGKRSSLISHKEYISRDGSEVYEIYGKFEVFQIETNRNDEKKIVNEIKNNQNRDNDNNTLILNTSDDYVFDSNLNNKENKQLNNDKKVANVSISFRSDPENFNNKGSITICLLTNGLVQVFVNGKLDQEANLQAANKFEFMILDSGESQAVRINICSYDEFDSKYSVELSVKNSFVNESEQKFYVSQTLQSDNFAVGIDALKISNEISDPQGRLNQDNFN
jgi:hypothetical protein